MASSSHAATKNTNAEKIIDDSQANPPNTQNHVDFVAEPDVLDDRAPQWRTQVLIPPVEPFTHAYLGPLPNPLLETVEVGEIFPSHVKLRSRIFDTTDFHLDFMKNPQRVFRAAPRLDQPTYIAWLDKVQGKKGEIWQEQGIFDFIQLSRYGPKYDSTLLLAAMHFWDISTHSLHLKCGMLSPTLLDVAAITGLKPLGDTFDPKLPTQDYGFDFNKASFALYIAENHVTDSEEVSDFEHIAFLTLWLSIFVLCSRSLQVVKALIPLATQIHERKNINLAQLVLGNLYQHLDGAALELKEDEPTNTFSVSGPLWLLQLWLVATFEIRLNLAIPSKIQPSLKDRRTEGIRLAQLTSKLNVSVDEAFSIYFEMFQNCTTFTDSMAPFVTRTHGPSWFISEFPAFSTEHAEEVNQIWRAYLSPCVLSTRSSPGQTKNSLGVSRYFPSYLSRQFGLCQIRPAPSYLHRRDFKCPENELQYKAHFKRFPYQNLNFEPIKFNPRCSCTKEFHDWWTNFYTTAAGGITDADLLAKMIAALPQEDEDTKGIPICYF